MQKVNVKDEWILSHAVSLSMLRDLVGLCTMSGWKEQCHETKKALMREEI